MLEKVCASSPIQETLPAGLEPATLRLTASRSNQLSYGSTCSWWASNQKIVCCYGLLWMNPVMWHPLYHVLGKPFHAIFHFNTQTIILWLLPPCENNASRTNTLRVESSSQAVMSQAGAWTWLQPTGHGDMQGFDSSFAAMKSVPIVTHLFIHAMLGNAVCIQTHWMNTASARCMPNEIHLKDCMACSELHALKFSPAMWNFLISGIAPPWQGCITAHAISHHTFAPINASVQKIIEKKMLPIASGYGLVAMTFASHAKGREFDPHYPYGWPAACKVQAICFSYAPLRLCLDRALGK